MSADSAKPTRSQQILQVLAEMLENPESKITTAALAKEVGVSEAALYRHFPSKTRMFEDLIDYMEEALFSRANQICRSDAEPLQKIYDLSSLFLIFAERNPGFCRLLTGEAIAGENQRLQTRISKVFDRLHLEFKQIIKQAELSHGLRPSALVTDQADLICAIVSGKISQFVRSQFQAKPMENWQRQFDVLSHNFFVAR